MDVSLWGELELGSLNPTPLDILKFQAAQLGRQTNNIVLAEVELGPSVRPFRFNFNLVVPALGDYSYTLFAVEQGAGAYPVTLTVVSDPDSAIAVCAEEETFVKRIQGILSSRRTHEVIRNLVSQARTVTPTSHSLVSSQAFYSDPSSASFEQVNIANAGRQEISDMTRDAFIRAFKVSTGEVIIRMNPETWNRYIPNISAGFYTLSREAQAAITYRCNTRQETNYIGIALFEIAGDYEC